MPVTDEGVDAVVEKDSADEASVRAREIALAIPEAAEPLLPENLNTLAQTIGPALERLTNGEYEGQAVPEFGQPQDAVPPELANDVIALGAMTTSLPGLEQYQFDPTAMLATNDGLVEVSALIDAMSKDKDVLRAMRQPARANKPPNEQGPAPEPAEEV
jgi:hypothetical protein